MTPESRVIASDGRCEPLSIPTTRVHHRDFPEIWAEGCTADEGAEHLINKLIGCRSSVGSGWRRDQIDRAIDDVRDYCLSRKAAAPTTKTNRTAHSGV